MSLDWALLSDTGRVRARNEDCARATPELGLFAIADGLGGHAGGDVASRVAVETALEFLRASGEIDTEALDRSQYEAHAAIFREAERSELWGMGTTLTVVHLQGRRGRLSHVGDTRAGLLHDGELTPLTRDETAVARLVDEGSLSPDQARGHPGMHVLTQALGTQTALEPQTREFEIPDGARLLLSSDGLHDLLPPDELRALAGIQGLEDAARALVERANQRGGTDNISVILVDP